MAARKAKAPKPAHHEIRFMCDGKPVQGLAPIIVWPAELHQRRGGLTLGRALQITIGEADPSVSVDAVKLTGLSENRWALLSSPIRIAPGATIELGANSLLFLE